jgi:hypothetical protein
MDGSAAALFELAAADGRHGIDYRYCWRKPVLRTDRRPP